MNKKKRKRRLEWSKILTIAILIPYLMCIFLSIVSVILFFINGQYDQVVSLITVLLAAVATPIAVVYGFYYWKSKAENLVKIAKRMKKNKINNDIAKSVVETSEINNT